MKIIELSETMVNQSNHIQTVSNREKKHLIKMIEKRYGIRIAQGIFVCEDRMIGVLGLPDCYIYKYRFIPPDMVLDRLVSNSLMSDTNITSLNEIYQVTNAGYNAKTHPINQNRKDGELLTRLIPVLIIHCKRKAFFFRVDNVIIRELFNDTKLIAEGRLNEDEKESLNRRYLAQKEYLNYCYAPLKSNLSLELWLNIDSEKSRAGKGNMLHSEYLDWKRTENN